MRIEMIESSCRVNEPLTLGCPASHPYLEPVVGRAVLESELAEGVFLDTPLPVGSPHALCDGDKQLGGQPEIGLRIALFNCSLEPVQWGAICVVSSAVAEWQSAGGERVARRCRWVLVLRRR